MNAVPKLSVVIATRNRATQLLATLNSLALQTFSPEQFEVIVVDNGSTDETPKVAAELGKRFSHSEFVVETKPGAAAARNAGIRTSHAERILFLDDDIVADANLLREHWLAHESDANAIVLGHVRLPWRGDESAMGWLMARKPELLQSFDFPNADDVPFLHFYTCNLSVPPSCFERAGLFDTDFGGSGFEDVEFGYRAQQAGFRVRYRAEASALHDTRMGFAQLAKKRNAAGRWLSLLLRKHPALRDQLLPRRSFRQRCATAMGAPSRWLTPVYSKKVPQPLLPLLGRGAWCALQWEYLQGFHAAERERVAARVAPIV